jgi:raffinose/stachyose/melibiose transport system permease protein
MSATTTTGDKNFRIKVRIGRVALYVAAYLILAFIVVPVLFAILGGFRTTSQIAADPVGLPNPWVFTSYKATLTLPAFWRQMFNSTLIALITTAVVLPVASLAAFVIARYRFRGRESFYTLFTLGLLFPVAVAIIPLFIVLRQIGMLNNPLGIALAQAAFALPLSIVILRPFLRSIPRDLEDAASIDGCTTFRFYWSVILPLSRPALATVAILTIVTSWNAFLLPLLVLIQPEQWTLPIGVNNISAQYTSDTARVLAYTSLSIIPALFFYFLTERQIVRGLTAGSLKG